MRTYTLSIHCHTHRSLWLFCTPMATQMVPRWHSSHRRFERSGAGFSALMAHTKPTQPRCGSVGEYPGGCCVLSKVEKNNVCNGCIILHLCMCVHIIIYIYKYTPVSKAFLNHKWHIQFYDIYLMRNILSNSPRWAKPIAEPWFWGTSPFHLLVGRKNADYWPIIFFLVSHHSLACHIQPADPHARAPSSIPWFPNFHLPSHNSTLETLVAGWWFHSALTCSALFEIMIPNSPIFLRRVKTTNYFTGQAGTDWLVCCSDSLQKHLYSKPNSCILWVEPPCIILYPIIDSQSRFWIGPLLIQPSWLVISLPKMVPHELRFTINPSYVCWKPT